MLGLADWQLDPRQLARPTMMLLGSIGCLTILGPFGTFNDFTFFKRIVYWATILVLCAPVLSKFLTLFVGKTGPSLRF